MKKRNGLYLPITIATLALAVSVMLPGLAVTGEDSSIEVRDYAFCTSVENREPISRERSFSSGTRRIYLWTLITSDEVPTKIKHIWYHGDKRMSKVKLDIPYERTRTWSYKTIQPSQTGDWYVDIIDCDGNLLKQVSFKVTE